MANLRLKDLAAVNSITIKAIFTDFLDPLINTSNVEIVAEEIVRTLVATIGLILAVPITTYIVCYRIGSEKGK